MTNQLWGSYLFKGLPKDNKEMNRQGISFVKSKYDKKPTGLHDEKLREAEVIRMREWHAKRVESAHSRSAVDKLRKKPRETLYPRAAGPIAEVEGTPDVDVSDDEAEYVERPVSTNKRRMEWMTQGYDALTVNTFSSGDVISEEKSQKEKKEVDERLKRELNPLIDRRFIENEKKGKIGGRKSVLDDADEKRMLKAGDKGNRILYKKLKPRVYGPTVMKPMNKTTDIDENMMQGKILKAEMAGKKGEAENLKRLLIDSKSGISQELVVELDISGRKWNESTARTISASRIGIGMDSSHVALEFGTMYGRGDNEYEDQLRGFSDGIKSRDRKRKRTAERSLKSEMVSETVKRDEIVMKCPYCIESKNFMKENILHLGGKSVILLEERGIVSLEMKLVPYEHIISLSQMDEDMSRDMLSTKRLLRLKFLDIGKTPIFIETAIHLKRGRHGFLRIYPVPLDLESDVALYFKKALSESGGEWSSHKKIIETSANKGVERSVPVGFPYFHVSFFAGDGLERGFLHVIENEKKFDADFGKEVVAGILELNPDEWKYKMQVLDGYDKRKAIEEFAKFNFS